MKQIIAVRTDLNMRKGKLAAQVAHASMGAVYPYVRFAESYMSSSVASERRHYLCVEEWFENSFTKICVGVLSEQELISLHRRAEQAGLITCLITDNGKTEFHGVPTRTCVAIGPATAENLDPITGHLKLL